MKCSICHTFSFSCKKEKWENPKRFRQFKCDKEEEKKTDHVSSESGKHVSLFLMSSIGTSHEKKGEIRSNFFPFLLHEFNRSNNVHENSLP